MVETNNYYSQGQEEEYKLKEEYGARNPQHQNLKNQNSLEARSLGNEFLK